MMVWPAVQMYLFFIVLLVNNILIYDKIHNNKTKMCGVGFANLMDLLDQNRALME